MLLFKCSPNYAKKPAAYRNPKAVDCKGVGLDSETPQITIIQL